MCWPGRRRGVPAGADAPPPQAGATTPSRAPRSPASWTAWPWPWSKPGPTSTSSGSRFAEYLQRWQAKRPEVLRWHDPRLMQYPASVAVTWETTFAQLGESGAATARGAVLAGSGADPALPVRRRAAGGGDPRPPRGAGGPGGLLAGAVRRLGRRGPGPPAGAGDHPRPHSRGRPGRHAANRPGRRECRRPGRRRGCPHLGRLDAPGGACRGGQPVRRRRRDRRADGPADESTGHVLAGAASSAPPSRSCAGPGDRRAELRPGPPQRRHRPQQPGAVAAGHQPAGEAEPLFRRALAIDERRYGPDHPNVATDLNNLAQLLQATNRLAEAEPLIRRALAIDERSLRPGPPRRRHPTSTTWRSCCRPPTDWPRPSRSMRRALAIDERSLRPGPPQRRHRPQQPGAVAAGHQPPGRGRAADAPRAGDRRAVATARTTPTSPSTSTTWRSCCRPPTGWPRPSRSTAADCRSGSSSSVGHGTSTRISTPAWPITAASCRLWARQRKKSSIS